MKSFKIAASLLAILFVVASAFTSKETLLVFYEYDATQGYSETELSDRTNYNLESFACGTPDENVCGVYLATDTQDDKPDATEFSAIVADILESQDQGESVNVDVKMRQ